MFLYPYQIALVKWEKESLQKKGEEDLEEKITRLRAFVEICVKYEKANKKGAR